MAEPRIVGWHWPASVTPKQIAADLYEIGAAWQSDASLAAFTEALLPYARLEREHRHWFAIHRHPYWRGHPRPDRWHAHWNWRHDHSDPA